MLVICSPRGELKIALLWGVYKGVYAHLVE